MEFRSTNTVGFVHFQGDLVTNVSSAGGSSHGVHLRGGSTGGVVEASGDETNVALTVRGKGNGPTQLGSSGTVTIGSSGGSVNVAGSTYPWFGTIRALDTAVSTPALFNDTDAGRVAETTHTVTGLTSQTYGVVGGYFVQVNAPNLPAAVTVCGAYVGSTANQLHVRLAKGSTVAVAGTTTTFEFLITRSIA